MAERHIDSILTALLDTLLPGYGDWPVAAETHVPAWVIRRANELSTLATALDALRASLPADFASRDLNARTAVLREAEARMPNLFAQIVDEAYRGYYTDARVLALMERKTGYPASPPQPLGRKVRPTDWSVLAHRRIASAPTSYSSGDIT